MDDTWNTDKQQQIVPKNVKILRAVIAISVSFFGFLLLFSQLLPLASSFIQGKVDEMRATNLARPVPDSYKELLFGSFAYYNPGLSYFQNLSKQVGELSQGQQVYYDPVTKQSKQIVIDKNYKKDMMLSVPIIGINKVNISANVESFDEKVYNLALKSGLAHFEGTPLPGDGGNSFIYGHSAVPSFFNRHKDLPETIFSRLEKVDIGAEISVFKDGKELKYIVRKKKIVESSDFSVLKTQGDKETITLMTCWPIGVPSKRLIVLGERYE
ncbi:sortase [bacterium]|nr:sortase [bacterium]